ncbi:TPA: hypothetical protein ACTY07_005390 [Citrobacter freundii]
MAKQHLNLAVRYVNSSSVAEMARKAAEVAKSLREDLEYLRETMLASGVGVAQDLLALSELATQLEHSEELLTTCEKAGRKVSREMREQLTEIA